MSIESEWTIAPLILATAVRDKSQTLLYRDIGVKQEGAVLAWLLISSKEKILVDTGASGVLNTPEFYGRYTQTSEQTLEAQLMRFNTSPDEIKMVINTHLHADHCAGNTLFKRAHFYVQKKEMDYARNPLPIHRHGYVVGLEGIKPLFEWVNFDLLEGEVNLAPGIKVLLTPGHTPGTQTVCVQTREGLYIIASDNIPFFENMAVPENASFWPSSIFVDLKEYYESLDRIKSLKGFILPGHDPRVMEKNIYP